MIWQVLAYLKSTRKACAQRLFDLRQPEHLEVSKYSATMGFLRSLLGLTGFQVVPKPERGPPPSEMEALANWLTSPDSKFAAHESGRAFHMARDAVVLFKFLATMETREAELLRKRKQVHRHAPFKLSFDPSGGLAGGRWARRAGGLAGGLRVPLQWEPVNFRGVDQSIADVSVTAFGARPLLFGEGLLVKSPADLARLCPDALPRAAPRAAGGPPPQPSEDDVLFAQDLPTFGGTLSLEESEALLSFLTVPYARVPLVLGFFASKDRAAYLMNAELQALLSAVLFEGGTWVDAPAGKVEEVPLRRHGAGAGPASAFAGGDEWADVDEAVGRPLAPEAALGTRHGLLMNELAHSPNAVVAPLLAIFAAATELRNTSVFSPDAQFILFILETAVHVEAYLTHGLAHGLASPAASKADSPAAGQQGGAGGSSVLGPLRAQVRAFLQGPMLRTLERWLDECAEDLPCACVVHAFRALLESNSSAEELRQGGFVRLAASLGFVNNWHGFGLGQQRSDFLRCAGDARDAEQRLVRFLQAHGVDTATQLEPGSLDKFLTGRSRHNAHTNDGLSHFFGFVCSPFLFFIFCKFTAGAFSSPC